MSQPMGVRLYTCRVTLPQAYQRAAALNMRAKWSRRKRSLSCIGVLALLEYSDGSDIS